jgi:hypothetical protein
LEYKTEKRKKKKKRNKLNISINITLYPLINLINKMQKKSQPHIREQLDTLTITEKDANTWPGLKQAPLLLNSRLLLTEKQFAHAVRNELVHAHTEGERERTGIPTTQRSWRFPGLSAPRLLNFASRTTISATLSY